MMTEPAESLYRRTRTDGAAEFFLPTSPEAVGSPWGPIQHGGPIGALLARAIDNCEPTADTRISRITIEILGPVPPAEVRVTARVRRPGRRIALLEATLEAQSDDGAWRPCALASAWRLSTQPTDDVARHADRVRTLPTADDPRLEEFTTPGAWSSGGFIGNIDWRIESFGGRAGEPTMAWTDLRAGLVEGEPPTELERLVAVADSANGVGARLDPARFAFLNTETTVHLYEPPLGPWYGIEAESSIGGDGVGMSHAVLHSAAHPIGKVVQSLLVQRL
ncbi:MAG: thioesterase family protein [Gordonia sp. (in: high G+C Gram-positive bacteria)]|uniref:thioesterase family protein n=1 Tax=Gordonia sp. (in: high G+C Gram-positive bacteria) TaxID=84139 RepID=UPI0039E5F072